MPRPKGSKNKKKTIASSVVLSVEDITLQIESTVAEIEEITASIKNKKAQLKGLKKEIVRAQEAAELKKAEEEKVKILEAIQNSGKSVDEILEMLQ